MKDEGSQRDLINRTKAFALRVIKCCCSLPKSTEARVLGKQVLRSSTSVGANLEASRLFFLAYPYLISETLSRISTKSQPDVAKWQPGLLHSFISWSHYIRQYY